MTEPAPTAAPGTPGSSVQENDPKVLAAALTTVLLWASAFLVIRDAGRHFDPGAMALLRMAVGSLALTAIVLVRGIRLPPRRSMGLVVLWGVAWFGLYNLALNKAERTVDASVAAMVVNLAPLIVVVLAGLLLREGYPRGLVIGAPISFLGVVLIGSQSWTGDLALGGLLLALAAAVLYAGSALLQKFLLGTLDSATLTWLGAVSGTVSLLPWTPLLIDDLQTAPPSTIAWVVYLGVFPTAIAFTTWAYVLRRSSAGRTAATTYAVPAIAIIGSWAILAEPPTALTLVGGALCLLGVWVTRRFKR